MTDTKQTPSPLTPEHRTLIGLLADVAVDQIAAEIEQADDRAAGLSHGKTPGERDGEE